MTDNRKHFRDLEEDEVFEIGSEAALQIVVHLISLCLSFMGPEKLKATVDRTVALAANAAAEEIEKKKFGPN